MITEKKISDAEIIRRVLQGEKSLYELIVRRYNPYLYKIGRSYNYNHEDTQDLMQDSFVDAYRNLHQFEHRAEFKTWLSRIMLHNCFKKKEKSSYKNEFAQELKENAQPMFTNSENDANRLIHSRELRNIIEQALSNLPEEYRLVFSLREINGMSVAETAELLHLTESNVKVRLNRSRNMLKNQLAKAYDPRELYEFNLIYCDGMVDRVMKSISEF